MVNVSSFRDWKLTGFASLKPNFSLVFSKKYKSSVKIKGVFRNLEYIFGHIALAGTALE